MHQQHRQRAKSGRSKTTTTTMSPSNSKLQLMRQQFYSNNERSASRGGGGQGHGDDSSSKFNENHQTTTATTTTSAGAPHQPIPKECFQQYNPAYHSASPSMQPASAGFFECVNITTSTTASAPSTPSGNLLDFPIDHLSDQLAALTTAASSNGTISSSSSDSQVATTATIDCNANQLAMVAGVSTEELNFSDNEQVWLIKSWPEILARVTFVTPIVLLGLIGNLTIIYSMCRFKPIRSKPTNIFILNMALADLLTTIVCPNAALLTDIYQFYVMGAFVCRTEGFIKITCLLVSAYSLIVLSCDWFLAVVKPCRTSISIKQAWLTLAIIWLASLVMASPLLHWRRLRERQWRDLTEIWCCELIQYTKYYWVCITLFLIYLPTFVMTIVLIVILAQMDRFEAKLRRSRGLSPRGTRTGEAGRLAMSSKSTTSTNHQGPVMTPSSSAAMSGTIGTISTISSTINNHNMWASQPTSNVPRTTTSQNARRISLSSATTTGGERQLQSSLTIGMKYRRRIMKILFFYLLTSIVCWTPLQFTIVYRHFRSEAVPALWYFELTFYSQLSASLSAAMNPIIFGFLSQPFRRMVTKSWMFRFLDKVWAGTRTKSGGEGGGGGEQHAMNVRHQQQLQAPDELGAQRAIVHVQMRHHHHHHHHHQQQQPQQQELEPHKLNIDYIEHNRSPGTDSSSSRRQSLSSSRRAAARQQRPLSANLNTRTHEAQHHRHRHHQQHIASIQRSRSSTQTRTPPQSPQATTASGARHKRVSFHGKSKSGGAENQAYIKDDIEEGQRGAAATINKQQTDRTTSFITKTTTTNGLKGIKN